MGVRVGVLGATTALTTMPEIEERDLTSSSAESRLVRVRARARVRIRVRVRVRVRVRAS